MIVAWYVYLVRQTPSLALDSKPYVIVLGI